MESMKQPVQQDGLTQKHTRTHRFDDVQAQSAYTHTVIIAASYSALEDRGSL